MLLDFASIKWHDFAALKVCGVLKPLSPPCSNSVAFYTHAQGSSFPFIACMLGLCSLFISPLFRRLCAFFPLERDGVALFALTDI